MSGTTIEEFFASIGIKIDDETFKGLEKIETTMLNISKSADSMVNSLTNAVDKLQEIGAYKVPVTGPEPASPAAAQSPAVKAIKAAAAETAKTPAAVTPPKKAGGLIPDMTEGVGKIGAAITEALAPLALLVYVFGKVEEVLGKVASVMYELIREAADLGQELKSVQYGFGIDPKDMQQWERLAELTGHNKDELANFAKTATDLRAKLRLNMVGDNQLRAWSLLGLNPNDDPSVQLEKIRKSLVGLNAEQLNSRRIMLNQIGISDEAFAALHEANERGITQTTLALRNLNKENVDASKGVGNSLSNLSSAWDAFKVRLGVSLGIGLAPILDTLSRFLDQITGLWNEVYPIVDTITEGLGDVAHGLDPLIEGLGVVRALLHDIASLMAFIGIGHSKGFYLEMSTTSPNPKVGQVPSGTSTGETHVHVQAVTINTASSNPHEIANEFQRRFGMAGKNIGTNPTTR